MAAIPLYQKAEVMVPEEHPESSLVSMNLGICFMTLGRHKESLKGPRPDTSSGAATTLMRYAWQCAMLAWRRFDGAQAPLRAAFQRAVKLNPAFRDGWVHLADAAVATHRHAAAWRFGSCQAASVSLELGTARATRSLRYRPGIKTPSSR